MRSSRVESKQRDPEKGFADEIAHDFDRRGHDGTGLRIAEEALDAGLSRKGGAAASAHGVLGDADRGLAARRLGLEHAQHGGLGGLLQAGYEALDPRREP